MNSKQVSSLFFVAASLSISGCASIMSGRHAEVTINSNPANAHVTVRDKRGQQVAALNTPATVTLKRKDRLILPARYTATIEAPGYQTAQVPIRSSVNPWILGNVVVGGIAGLVVDNVTGAAWKPRDPNIYHVLTPIYTAQQTAPYPHVHTAQHASDTGAQSSTISMY
jgi:uncharacterized protein YceK